MMNDKKYILQHLIKSIIFILAGCTILAFIIGALNDFDSYLTSSNIPMLLGFTIIIWGVLVIIVRFCHPYFLTKDGHPIRVTKLGREFHFGFIGIIATLAIYYFFITSNSTNNILQKEPFSKEDSALRVIVLPFRADIKSKTVDIDYVSQLKEYLQNIKNSDEYTFKMFFPKPDTQNIAISETDAIEIGERNNADLVIWGSFEEKIDQPYRLRVRYVLTSNYHGIIDSTKRSGDTEMQSINTLSQLRRGYLLNDVSYILNWTEGISSYKKYNYDRSVKYFEKARDAVNAESYGPRVNILLANLYQELGSDSIAYTYCIKALQAQSSSGDTSSSFYAYLLLCSGSTIDHNKYQDSAFYFINRGISLLENSINKDSSNLAIGYAELGKLYYELGKADLAEQKYTIALKYLTEWNRNHVQIMVGLYYNIGIIKSDFQLQDAGLSLLRKALLLHNSVPNPNIFLGCQIYEGIGNIYSQKGNFDSAIKYYRLVNHILSASLSSYNRKANLFSNIGTTFSDADLHDSAKYYIQKAKNMMVDNQDTSSILAALININLSEEFRKDKNFDTALALEFQSERILLSINSSYYPLAVVYTNVSDIYWEKGDIVMADKYLLKAWKILMKNTLDSNNKAAYNPLDPYVGYYYWTKGKVEKEKGAIINSRNNLKKALKIFNHQNYPDSHKDLIKLRKFANEIGVH